MPVENGVETVKRCPPFLEAMTAGYIIPVPADITIIRTESKIDVHAPDCHFPLIQMHEQRQFPGAPFANAPLVKFISPWLITTPPGYSTLFLPPLNRFESPVVPLSGLVETDTYYRGVAFPAVCLLEPGTEATLKRGSPLVQIIPVLREEWKAAFSGWDEARMEEQDEQLTRNAHMYKDQHWQKKTFG